MAKSELQPSNRRLEFFSDGVFAIGITIMVIEIRVPDVLAFASDRSALDHLAGELLAYALSFLVIANLWTSHHYLLFTLNMPARSTLWFNNLLLFTVTLIPIATRFLGKFPNSPSAAALYGAAATSCTAAFMLLRSHAARMTHNELHRAIHRRILRRTWLILGIYSASIPLAFTDTRLAWACFVIVPPMLFLPIIRANPAEVAMMMDDPGIERSCP